MSSSFNFNPDSPAQSEWIRVSWENIRNNFRAIEESFGKDHVSLTDPDSPARGLHRKITFDKHSASVPPMPSDQAVIYSVPCKNVNTTVLAYKNSAGIFPLAWQFISKQVQTYMFNASGVEHKGLLFERSEPLIPEGFKGWFPFTFIINNVVAGNFNIEFSIEISKFLVSSISPAFAENNYRFPYIANDSLEIRKHQNLGNPSKNILCSIITNTVGAFKMKHVSISGLAKIE